MSKTEKELKDIEAKLKQEAERLESEKKNLETKKEEFFKQMDEEKKLLEENKEKAHKEFQEHIDKEQKKLMNSVKLPSGMITEHKSVFKAYAPKKEETQEESKEE